jgi:hypothetical protein
MRGRGYCQKNRIEKETKKERKRRKKSRVCVMRVRERRTGENKQEEKGIVLHLWAHGVNTLSLSEFDRFFVPTK